MVTELIQKAIILNRSGEILMLRRSKTDVRRPLQWDLPGGMHEKDEELIESVRREIVEETGLRISGLKPIYSKTEVRTWKNHTEEYIQNAIFLFYLGKTDNNNIKISYEHSESQWKAIDSAIKDFEYPLHKEVLQYISDKDLIKDALSK